MSEDTVVSGIQIFDLGVDQPVVFAILTILVASLLLLRELSSGSRLDNHFNNTLTGVVISVALLLFVINAFVVFMG